MSDSTILPLADLELDHIRLLDQSTFLHVTYAWQSTGSNNYTVEKVISGYTPGWYLISLSFGTVNGSGCRMRVVHNGVAILNVSAGNNITAGGEDIKIQYLDGNNLSVEYARSSSVGGIAYFQNITVFGLLLSDDPEN